MDRAAGRPENAPEASASSAAMELGDTVILEGRRLVLRGLDPMSVENARAALEDPATGELVFVPLSDLPPEQAVSGRTA